ncbi:MAG: RidA/YER057c/UK114 superfamily, group 1 [uncultured Rubrobacteraceae bacterium]|uniref:RidA/YER057c/UK114 superfamily, group 1 n=1 Tax=uncultured Rubrobacteraceae bacterium TaxID=349277 RepID=A0A6J4RN98_9ACTN|nr:MAG: RidA/YER057c/UK114 superfamily, group 1 [uncultured Rubrobacteraceae bacterium]
MPENKLRELGLELPPVAKPAGSYLPAVRAGTFLFTAGQLPFEGGELRTTGKVGAEVTPEEAHEAARLCALNALAAVAAEAGGLSNVRRIVKVTGFVASAPGFNGQAAVLNGASELLGEIFGEAGLHARSAVGVVELPLDAPVEVELIVELTS